MNVIPMAYVGAVNMTIPHALLGATKRIIMPRGGLCRYIKFHTFVKRKSVEFNTKLLLIHSESFISLWRGL